MRGDGDVSGSPWNGRRAQPCAFSSGTVQTIAAAVEDGRSEGRLDTGTQIPRTQPGKNTTTGPGTRYRGNGQQRPTSQVTVRNTAFVPIDDPAMLDALAKYNSRSRETRRRADITTSIMLLIVHGVLAFGTALALFGAVDNDACAYLQCVDQAWFSQAFGVAVLTGGLIFVADLAVVVLRIRRRRLAFAVPIIGCVAQVALAFATYTMISEAGLG